jgi:hypothetical protein
MVGTFLSQEQCECAENLAATGVTTAALSKAAGKVVRDAHVSLPVAALQHVQGNYKPASTCMQEREWGRVRC